MKGRLSAFTQLTVIGIASVILYGYALRLKDLRLNTTPFLWVFFAAFGLYALAAWQVLKENAPAARRLITLIFCFAILFRAILIFSQPTLSDDMYRYIWDGRVQASHINPYWYSPSASELAGLRDTLIWPLINRKSVVTVYPAGAELAFAAIWRIWPDQVHGFQIAMVLGDMVAAVLLVFILRVLGRSPNLVLIYLWNPLVIFEIAHSAHVDGLVLPLLVGAWLARLKNRDALTGFLLGIATSLKFFPVLLFPVLWHKRDEKESNRSTWTMPLAFLIGFSMAYLPYLSTDKAVLGFLPQYFQEASNFLLTAPLYYWVLKAGGRPDIVVNGLIGAVLLGIYVFFLFHPPEDGETALRRSIWPIGAYTLLTFNLQPWYMLWLIPLLSMFLPTHQADSQADLANRLLYSSWTGWWLFSGLIALAYTYYIHWWPNLEAIFAQFVPLYEFLLIDLGRRMKRKFTMPRTGRSIG